MGVILQQEVQAEEMASVIPHAPPWQQCSVR